MRKHLSPTILLLILFFISCFISDSKAQAAYTWGNLPIGAGGFVSAIIPSKTEQGLIYARTDVGGAYRWDAGTSKWIALNDWVSDSETGYLGVESIATDPVSPNKLYMLVGISYFNGGKTAILRSDDYGATFSIIDVSAQFKAHGNGMGRQTGEKLVIDPNNTNTLFCGTRRNGLFKSTNAGANWTNINALGVTSTPNDNGLSFVVLDPSKVSGGNTQTMFIGVSRFKSTGPNFYRTDDGGQTFTAVSGGPTDFMPHRAVLASDGNLYITYGNGAGPHGHWAVPEPMDNGQIWKYNTSSGVWTNVTPSGYARAFGGITVDPSNPNRIVATTINTYMAQGSAWGDRIFISTNGGSSWTDVIERGFSMDVNGSPWIGGHAIHWAGSIEFDPFNTQKVWVTSGNGIFTTDNIDAVPTVWRFEVDNLEETVPLDLVSIPNGPVVSVIGDYDGFRHTDVTQYAPIHTPRMGTTTGLDYAELNPNVMVRVGNEMYYSTDMGISWTQCSINGVKGKIAVSANGTVFLHSPEQSSTTYRSTNNGTSWTTVTGLSISEAKPVSDPVNTNKFYAYNNSTGSMMISTDGGVSFATAGSVGSGGSKVIRATPGMEGHLWVPLYGGGLSRSTNSGQSFTKISSVSYCGAVGLGKAADGQTYPALYIWGTVNGVLGLHRSTDQGTTWVRINDNDHEYGGPGNGQFVVGDMNQFGRVYMSTAGRGIVMGQETVVDPNTDCAGVSGGTAYYDECNTCVGGTTGKEACVQDCNNEWGGTAYTDACGTCVGGSTGLNPCADIQDGNYIIKPVHSSLCLQNSDPVKQQTCAVSDQQVWTITKVGGNYQIKVVSTGEYLNVASGTAGTYVNTSSTPTDFRIESNGSGQLYIKPASNHTLYFDIEGNNTAAGGNVLLWTLTGNTNQLFTITPDNNTYDCNLDWAGTAEIDVCGDCAGGNTGLTPETDVSQCTVTGVKNTSLESQVRFYPNPFSGEFYLEVPGKFDYVIYDLAGQAVERGTGSGTLKTGSSVKPGVYMVEIKKDGELTVIRVNKY